MRGDQSSLSEAAARRLLARAVELDARFGSMVTYEELRAAALEAGVSAAAFDAALGEHVSGPPATRNLPLRVMLRLNGLAAGGSYLFIAGGARVARWLGGSPTLLTFCLLVAVAAGVGLAHRLSARLTRDVLIAVGAGQLVVFAFSLAGIQVTEPHVLNWGVLFTGVLAALGTRVTIRDGRPPFLTDSAARIRSALRWIRKRVTLGTTGSSSTKCQGELARAE